MKDLRVTTIQSELAWEDKAFSLARMEKHFASLTTETDLIILPEMFSTGFSMRSEELAETMEGPTMKWLSEWAEKMNAAITGSIIAREGGKFYNRLVWMQPDGKWLSYDKKHLFFPAGERDYFSPGDNKLIVNIKGWKVRPLICYDLRFPVWSRNTDDYDLLLYVANWPQKRSHAWKSLLVARAIENQAYVIGVNRVGEDGEGIYYSGDSSVIDYMGEILYRAGEDEEVKTTSLSHEEMTEFRIRLPFLSDRDSFRFT